MLKHPLQAEAGETADSGASSAKQAKPKISVTMEDSRVVEFPQDTKAKKTTLYRQADNSISEDSTLEAVGVRWDFANGATRTVLLSDLSPLSSLLQAHGLSQKLGDEYASEKDVDDATLAFDNLLDRLKRGEWSERREGGGFGGASILAKALAEVFSKSMEEVREFLRQLSPAEKMALRQTPELKPTIERLEADKAKGGKVDTGAIFSRLKAA